MLPTALLDRPVAAHPGKHDLDLLLRRPRAVLPVLAQRDLLRLSGPCSKPRRTRSAPRPYRPRLRSRPGSLSQLPVNTSTGSGPVFATRSAAGLATWIAICRTSTSGSSEVIVIGR